MGGGPRRQNLVTALPRSTPGLQVQTESGGVDVVVPECQDQVLYEINLVEDARGVS